MRSFNDPEINLERSWQESKQTDRDRQAGRHTQKGKTNLVHS